MCCLCRQLHRPCHGLAQLISSMLGMRARKGGESFYRAGDKRLTCWHPLCGRIAKSRQGRPKIAHGFNRGSQWKKVRAPEGRKKMLTAQPGSAVPDGTLPVFAPIPTDESVGYFLSPCWAGAHSKSSSIYFIAPINFTLSCASTKLVPMPRSGVCVKITQPPFALFPPVPS